jgi:hypothetical protein
VPRYGQSDLHQAEHWDLHQAGNSDHYSEEDYRDTMAPDELPDTRGLHGLLEEGGELGDHRHPDHPESATSYRVGGPYSNAD